MASIYLPRECLILLYYAFFYSHLTYCLEFWSASGTTLHNPIIIAQKKVIRIVALAPYLAHTEALAKNLNIFLFDDLVYFVKCLFMYKVFRKKVCNEITCLFCIYNNVYTRQQNVNFAVARVVHTCCKRFIAHHGVLLWNNLPSSIKSTLSEHLFKIKLRAHINTMKTIEYVL